MMMKRTLVLVAFAAVCSAMGQQLPSDVPANHWAAPAVSKLYELGVLQGYPDGLYRGTRPVSRYEMAQAINKLFSAGKALTDDLQRQLNELNLVPIDGPQDFTAMSERLSTLGLQVNDLNRQGQQINDLKDTFSSLDAQLKAIRGNLNSMKLPDVPKKSG
jgi:hypothetical protein